MHHKDLNVTVKLKIKYLLNLQVLYYDKLTLAVVVLSNSASLKRQLINYT